MGRGDRKELGELALSRQDASSKIHQNSSATICRHVEGFESSKERIYGLCFCLLPAQLLDVHFICACLDPTTFDSIAENRTGQSSSQYWMNESLRENYETVWWWI